MILTSDQASCLIADKGTEIMIELPGQPQQPVNVGDVSLGMLINELCHEVNLSFDTNWPVQEQK